MQNESLSASGCILALHASKGSVDSDSGDSENNLQIVLTKSLSAAGGLIRISEERRVPEPAPLIIDYIKKLLLYIII